MRLGGSGSAIWPPVGSGIAREANHSFLLRHAVHAQHLLVVVRLVPVVEDAVAAAHGELPGRPRRAEPRHQVVLVIEVRLHLLAQAEAHRQFLRQRPRVLHEPAELEEGVVDGGAAGALRERRRQPELVLLQPAERERAVEVRQIAAVVPILLRRGRRRETRASCRRSSRCCRRPRTSCCGDCRSVRRRRWRSCRAR